MQTDNRNKALLEVIRQGLEVFGECQTASLLGNRASYLGLSDLARYSECPRAVLAGKLFPMENSLEQLLTLQRGHWFEKGISECLTSCGLQFMPQLEISINHAGTPIQGHLDFTLVWDKPYPAVRIMEVKTMTRLPDAPYTAHVFQTQAQVSLLTQFWNHPVFSLRDSSGALLCEKLTFPQICLQNLGVKLPDQPDKISVESWLLCLSMKEAAAFGPYVHNHKKLEEVFSLAGECWAQYGMLRHSTLIMNDLPFASGFYPLCGCCQYNSDCPKFRKNEYQPEWENALARHEDLKARRTALDAEIREIETSLKQYHAISGNSDWIRTGSHRFRISTTAGRKTLDRDSLYNELEGIFARYGIDEFDVNTLFARHEKQGASSTRLNIMPIN